MSPDRNAPCPCGSGKKYKRCCGAPQADIDPVTLNRDVAYAGEIGRRRQQFCLDYTAYKKEMLAEGENLLEGMAAAKGQTISCQKGCAKCCILYVFATLQEAECIVHYLYRHEAVLQHFLSAYRDWRRGLGVFENKLPRLERLIARNLYGELSTGEQERFSNDIDAYTSLNITCPFLLDDACSIYEVRPFVCAGVVAVTPAEKCLWGVSGVNKGEYHRLGFDLEKDMPYFVRPRDPIFFGCLPEMVHHLLEQGYSFLAGIEGLEEFRRLIPGR